LKYEEPLPGDIITCGLGKSTVVSGIMLSDQSDTEPGQYTIVVSGVFYLDFYMDGVRPPTARSGDIIKVSASSIRSIRSDRDENGVAPNICIHIAHGRVSSIRRSDGENDTVLVKCIDDDIGLSTYHAVNAHSDCITRSSVDEDHPALI
jgi:hypothetical protein